MWRVSHRMSNQKRRARLIMTSFGGTLRRGLRRMLLHEKQADVIVNVHPFFTINAMAVLRNQPSRPAFINVVADLVSTHAFWYDRSVDRILVPTQPAFDYGLRLGILPEQMRVTGLPVSSRFTRGLMSKSEARAKLGWLPDVPTILLIGGGEGMGPLYRIAQRLNRLPAKCQIAIVAGRNQLLRERLDAVEWQHPAHIYGFATNMPELMAAADLLVTKAGPATISEACIAGLPMILSGAIPGQEDGNVTYITSNQAGVYAPNPAKVAKAVAEWLAQGPDFLRERAENTRKLARPDAVWEVADEIWDYAQRGRVEQPIKRRRRPLLRLRVPVNRRAHGKTS